MWQYILPNYIVYRYVKQNILLQKIYFVQAVLCVFTSMLTYGCQIWVQTQRNQIVKIEQVKDDFFKFLWAVYTTTQGIQKLIM